MNYEITDNIENIIIAYKTCKDERKKRVLHLKIVQEIMTYVKKIANVISQQSNTNIEDLIQVGSLGLIKAIELYKPATKAKFKTYATYLIKGEMQHYLRDKVGIIKAPRELQELVTKISEAILKLNKDGIKEPSAQDIAEILDIDIRKVEEVLDIDKYRNAISLDQYLKSDEEDTSLLDKIPAGDYQELIEAYENKILLSDAILKLPKDLREIIRLTYFEDYTHKEIAKQLNLSQMQVSRKLKKALNKMYEIIGENTWLQQ